jgi:pimeloyl-ACP methyl ester carboxylesterase
MDDFATMPLKRRQFDHDGLTFSFLDAGGDGRPLIALHAHLMEAATFTRLAADLAPAWRLIALDQRGHGHSSHASSYRRDDYVADVLALYTHLGLVRAVLLGNSLGGINAIQFAARHPDKAAALVIEDIGVVVNDDISFILPWKGTYPTREDLAARIGERFAPFFADSFRQTPSGWRLAFEPRQMLDSQHHINGDHWQDWLASSCPALLLRGSTSRVTKAALLEEMALRRPSTTLVTLEGGHVLHTENPAAFTAAVRSFLDSLNA